MEAEAVDRHDETAEFGDHVRAFGQFGDRAFPVLEYLGALAGVRPNTERAAEVVEDDRLVRERPRQIGQLGNLRMVQPAVEGHAALAEFLEAGAEPGVREHPLPRRGMRVAHVVAGIPARSVPDPSEPRTGRSVRVENVADGRAEVQVGVPDDGGASSCRSVAAARAHRRDAVDELRLADGLQRLRPIGAVHRAAFHEHRGDDVVAAAGVGEQLVEQIAVLRVVPEVVVRVADRQLRLDDLLGDLRKPLIAVHSDESWCLGHAQ